MAHHRASVWFQSIFAIGFMSAMAGCYDPSASSDVAVGSEAVVAVSSWPQFGQSPLHLNTNPERAFTPQNVAALHIAWAGDYGTNTNAEGGAAVSGGIAYIAGFDGALSAFRTGGCGAPTCQPLWRGLTTNDITSTPAVSGGLVLVGSADHFLYAFPAAGCGRPTCAPKWKGQLADAVIESSVAVANGIAYVGDFSGKLYAFTASGCGQAVCQPLWIGQAGPNEEFTSSPAVGNGSVFIGTTINTPDDVTGRMLVFSAAGCGNKKTCAPSWVADIGGPAGRTSSPTISGATVFMGSSTRFGGVNPPAHLFAFPTAGCGKKTCLPLRSYDVGDGGIETTPAVVGNTLLATTQNSPDPNTIGVVAAFSASGCGHAICEPIWTGVNFVSGFASSPSVAGNVVFVGKGPADFPPPNFTPDAGVYAFDVRGCGAAICSPLAFLEMSPNQFYLGAPVAVAEGKVFMASNDNDAGRSFLYALTVGP